MMEYGDIGIKDEDDVLEALRAGAFAGELHEWYGERINGLLHDALDKLIRGRTWGAEHFAREQRRKAKQKELDK